MLTISDIKPADIVEIRKKARLNQTLLGKICGLSKTAVVNWEKPSDDPLHSTINGAAAQLLLMIKDDTRHVDTFLRRAEDDIIINVLPEEIVDIRKRARLNQTQFGKICGVLKYAVVNWEKPIDDPQYVNINGAAAQVLLMIKDDPRNVETFLERAGV